MKITIGEYTIWVTDADKIWIQNEDGEGMELPLEELEAEIHEFFLAKF
jgi:hypothetical protein